MLSRFTPCTQQKHSIMYSFVNKRPTENILITCYYKKIPNEIIMVFRTLKAQKKVVKRLNENLKPIRSMEFITDCSDVTNSCIENDFCGWSLLHIINVKCIVSLFPVCMTFSNAHKILLPIKTRARNETGN